MNTSLAISKSGLHGLQTNLDSVANNIANVNTTGFKAKEVAFQELLLNDFSERQVTLSNTLGNGGINRGVKASVAGINQQQGSLQRTGQGTDLAIEGSGYFGTEGANNEMLLTRDGSFQFNEQRTLVDRSGQAVAVNYHVPKNNWSPGQPSLTDGGGIRIGTVEVGQVLLFQAQNQGELLPVGDNQFAVLGAGVTNSLGNEANFGVIKQGFLEASNVDLASSMTDLIVTQRAYSLNSRVLQATDEMMQRTNDFN